MSCRYNRRRSSRRRRLRRRRSRYCIHIQLRLRQRRYIYCICLGFLWWLRVPRFNNLYKLLSKRRHKISNIWLTHISRRALVACESDTTSGAGEGATEGGGERLSSDPVWITWGDRTGGNDIKGLGWAEGISDSTEADRWDLGVSLLSMSDDIIEFERWSCLSLRNV